MRPGAGPAISGCFMGALKQLSEAGSLPMKGLQKWHHRLLACVAAID